MIERILAPNPGPMTLTGTNTYVLDDGAGDLAVIDPGPDDIPSHLEAIVAAVERRGGPLRAVLVTHRHLDHLPLASRLHERFGAPLLGHPDLPGVQQPVADGEVAFGSLVAYDTPGHTRDSLTFWDADQRLLFTGDLVLGTGTTVLDEAPGALSDYLGSLERLLALQPQTIYPGHGPIVEDAAAKLREYLMHRGQRVRQVLDALATLGTASVEQLVRAIYTDTPEHLYGAAARNVRANLELLSEQGTVVESPAGWRLSSSASPNG
jgi:glyoxylase-like metal-dependent hydrolase (beta-lactamase superfamily II)